MRDYKYITDTSKPQAEVLAPPALAGKYNINFEGHSALVTIPLDSYKQRGKVSVNIPIPNNSISNSPLITPPISIYMLNEPLPDPPLSSSPPVQLVTMLGGSEYVQRITAINGYEWGGTIVKNGLYGFSCEEMQAAIPAPSDIFKNVIQIQVALTDLSKIGDNIIIEIGDSEYYKISGEEVVTEDFYIHAGDTTNTDLIPNDSNFSEYRVTPLKCDNIGYSEYRPEYYATINGDRIKLTDSPSTEFAFSGYIAELPRTDKIKIEIELGNTANFKGNFNLNPYSFEIGLLYTTQPINGQTHSQYLDSNIIEMWGETINKPFTVSQDRSRAVIINGVKYYGSTFEGLPILDNGYNYYINNTKCVIEFTGKILDNINVFDELPNQTGKMYITFTLMASSGHKAATDIKPDVLLTYSEEQYTIHGDLKEDVNDIYNFYTFTPKSIPAWDYYCIQLCGNYVPEFRGVNIGISGNNGILWLSSVDHENGGTTVNVNEKTTSTNYYTPFGNIFTFNPDRIVSSDKQYFYITVDGEKYQWIYEPGSYYTYPNSAQIEYTENDVCYADIYIPRKLIEYFGTSIQFVIAANKGALCNWDYMREHHEPEPPEPPKDSCRIVFENNTGANKSSILLDVNADAAGGCGTFSTKNDHIYPVQVPTDYSAEFLNLYSAKEETLSAIKTLLWQTEPSIWDTIKGTVSNALNCIVTLHCIPLPPEHAGSTLQAIRLGNQLAPTGQAYPLKRYVLYESNDIEINEFYSTSLDYEPYTTIKIYLPYAGAYSLKPSEVVGGTVSIKLLADFLTGDIGYTVICAKNTDEYTMYHFSGNCRADIPIASSDYSALLTNALKNGVGSVMTIAGGLATNSALSPLAVASGALGAVGTITQAQHDYYNPDITHSENISGNSGWLGTQVPYIYIEHPVTHVAENFGNLAGYDSYITKTLSDVSGFSKVAGVHLDGIPATAEELDEIESLLKRGVIV